MVEAYGADVHNLMKRSDQMAFLSLEKENGCQEMGYWPSVEYIRSRSVMGSQRAGIKVIGSDNDSEGSELIIRLADEKDELFFLMNMFYSIRAECEIYGRCCMAAFSVV